MADKTLSAVIQQTYVQEISTSVDERINALGM
jgi:hypothetical protein